MKKGGFLLLLVALFSSGSMFSCKEKKYRQLSEKEMAQISKLNPTKDTTYIDSLGQVWKIKLGSRRGVFMVSPE